MSSLFFIFYLCGFESEFYVNIFFWIIQIKWGIYILQFSEVSLAFLYVYKFKNLCASQEHIWCKKHLFHCSNCQRFRSMCWALMNDLYHACWVLCGSALKVIIIVMYRLKAEVKEYWILTLTYFWAKVLISWFGNRTLCASSLKLWASACYKGVNILMYKNFSTSLY